MSTGRRRAAIAAVALVSLLAGAMAAPAGVAARPPRPDGLPTRPDSLPVLPDLTAGAIVVSTLSDAVANDGACSLREAITAAVTNTPSADTTGRCRAGSAEDADLIEFAVGGTITLTADLPVIDEYVAIDGSTAPTPITIDGADAWRPFSVETEGAAELYDLTITNGFSADAGGAILNRSFVALVRVTVSSSTATLAGGGVSSGPDSFLYTEQSAVTGNATSGYGGGVRSAGLLYLYDTIVSGNTAASGGGGVAAFNTSYPAYADFTTISGNAATGPAAGGGGIDSIGPLLMMNATVADNTAAVGGGIRDTGELDLLNVTVTGNSAASGAGIHSTGTPVAVNTIVLGNAGSDPELVGTLAPTSGSNLVALPDGTALSTILDPAGLADNGGPTPTVALVRDAANPAWNGGDGASCLALDVVMDQRWFERSTPCDIGAYEIDDLAPRLSSPTPTVTAGGKLSGTQVTGRIKWTTTENGSGVTGQELQVNVNGTGFVDVPVTSSAAWADVAFANGSTYQFRVRAIDAELNQSAWKVAPSFTAKLSQQTASSVAYSSGWRSERKSAYSGGSAKFARTKGAWVKFTATGRSFSWITTKGPGRGKAKVYVDGTYVATVDLKAASNTYRVQAWTKSFSSSKKHVIKIVLLGTSGRPRVDADAFAVLR